jgi:hypothetical protein
MRIPISIKRRESEKPKVVQGEKALGEKEQIMRQWREGKIPAEQNDTARFDGS